jgi:predicted metal-dependent hydrolase
MAQKTVFVPEIGELVLSKRRGATNMRLSINAAGKVRVGMPYWAPYHAGVAFAKSKADWISKNLARHSNRLLEDGDLIGKSHRLQYVFNKRTDAQANCALGKLLQHKNNHAQLLPSPAAVEPYRLCFSARAYPYAPYAPR